MADGRWRPRRHGEFIRDSAARIITEWEQFAHSFAPEMDLGAGIPVLCAEMDLEEICRQTVDEIASFYPRCSVQFAASGELRVAWDSGRIAQSISNLVGNACQHGSKGVPVHVTLLGEFEGVALVIHNQGPAIPKQHLQDIFSPFRQLGAAAEPSSGVGSIGLGLYIAKAIVTAHKGTLEFESGKDGTTFTMRLPR